MSAAGTGDGSSSPEGPLAALHPDQQAPVNRPGGASSVGRHEYGVVFCGGGPAATGVIVCAAQHGRLEELLARGVLVIEKGALLGPGSIGHYRIAGNTRGISFLRCLEKAVPRELFDAVLADASTQALRRRSFVFPPLPMVGSYLEHLGATVEHILESHPACAVVRRTAVRTVRLVAGGGVRVTAEPTGASRETLTVTAARAVIAMGGCEPPALEKLGLLPLLTLEAYGSKLCHASALIDDRLNPPRNLVEAVRETRSAVVVGGSHSAWSAAWVLVHNRAFRGPEGDPPTVTVLHRSPLRFFYQSAAKARAAGYAFDEALDVCPLTGRVNRHGGLRGDAHALARAAVGFGPKKPPVRAIHLVDDPATRSEVVRALENAGLVVAGVGYHARLPELAWQDGRPLEPAMSETGLVVTKEARLVADSGMVVTDILAYGLGAGPAASGELAGEPSYTGRVDAVRLYQNEVGRIVLESLLSDDPPRAVDSLGRGAVAAASAPYQA